jgi:hypothetical protein
MGIERYRHQFSRSQKKDSQRKKTLDLEPQMEKEGTWRQASEMGWKRQKGIPGIWILCRNNSANLSFGI